MLGASPLCQARALRPPRASAAPPCLAVLPGCYSSACFISSDLAFANTLLMGKHGSWSPRAPLCAQQSGRTLPAPRMARLQLGTSCARASVWHIPHRHTATLLTTLQSHRGT